jgi:hypothetical protein
VLNPVHLVTASTESVTAADSRAGKRLIFLGLA